MVLAIGALVAGCGSGQIDVAPRCGDGVIDPGEDCDDSNQQDGDGCSASCEIEMEEEPEAGFECVELLEAVKLDAWAVANAEDGSVVVGGRIAASAESESRGWIGSFDAEGNQLWLREYEGATGIRALRASGDGFLALKRAPEQAVLRLDAQGNVEAETSIDRNLLAMVETLREYGEY